MENADAKFDMSEYFDVAQDEACKDFIKQQTMIRIKDPKASLDFYVKTLGFHLVSQSHFP